MPGHQLLLANQKAAFAITSQRNFSGEGESFITTEHGQYMFTCRPVREGVSLEMLICVNLFFLPYTLYYYYIPFMVQM